MGVRLTRCTSYGRVPMGVHLTDVYHMGVYLTGRTLHGSPKLRAIMAFARSLIVRRKEKAVIFVTLYCSITSLILSIPVQILCR
jgi:hypothetical protein